MASNVNIDETKTVSNLFDEGFSLFNAINETSEATNSETVQNDVKKAIKMLEDCTRLVSMANVFSTNESIEELPPNDIKFLLLPALLGMLHLKICRGDRKELVDVAEIYFKDYLKRCYQYGLTENDQSTEINGKKANESNEYKKTEGEIIAEIVNRRSEKIKRYKEQKALDEKIKYLKQNLVDDEVKRDFYITLVKSFLYQVIDEIKTIEMEKPMLEMFLQRNKSGSQVNRAHKSEESSYRPLKPVIITKDDVQKAVFGAGYPSLPVMTVKEFYDQRVAEGIFPDPNKRKDKPLTLQEMAALGITPDTDAEERERDEKIDNDDPELLEQLRRKDEMKDQFRRGWGNRMNRS